jgi:hypothetical protein
MGPDERMDLGNELVLQSLWSRLGPDERRALRASCVGVRDTVDTVDAWTRLRHDATEFRPF